LQAVVGRAVEMAPMNQAAERNGADAAAGKGISLGNGVSTSNGSGGATSGNPNGLPPGPLLSASAGTDIHHGPGLLALEQLARDLLQTEPGSAYRRLTALVDEAAVQEALNCARGNQLQAAALLGISRTTLRAKLRAMGLSVAKHVYLNRASD
jgi:DNA-binding NtrC family response regulator